MINPAKRYVLACGGLFFASGVAGLVYEIVWTRMLTAAFGAGIYAISAVLAGFMAGLALGAAGAGRFADRLRRPLFVYGGLELAIAASGLALPPLLEHVGLFDAWLYQQWGQDFVLLTVCRFVAAFSLLLVPTTLMGATLPVLARALVQRENHLGSRVGALYAINTAGAIAGAFLSGFYFLGRFGLMSTELIAVGLNVAAGLGAFALAAAGKRTAALPSSRRRSGVERLAGQESGVRGQGSGEGTDPSFPMSHPSSIPMPAGSSTPFAESRIGFFRAIREVPALGLVLACVFVSGLVALAAQVLWARSLIFVFDPRLKNTTYCFSAMLSVFLTGLAVGSALSGLCVDRLRSPLTALGVLLSLLGASIGASVLLLRWDVLVESGPGAESGPVSMPGAVAGMIWQTIAVIGIPTLLMGMAFPVAIKAVTSVDQVGRHVGWMYSLNTAGAVLGSVAAAFLIVPAAGLTGGLLLLAGVESLLGLFVLWRAGATWRPRLAAAAMIAAACAAIGWSKMSAGGLQQLDEGEALVFYEEGPVATVSVIEDASGRRRICVDDIPVAGTSSTMQTDQKSLAHLPMLLVNDPRSVLTVGFGSGGASYSFLLHDCLERVECVEICPGVVRAAPFMTDANRGFLDNRDPRYRLIYDDARAWLRYTTQRYDVISTDCTDLRYKSSANLYDVEYFQYCRKKLQPGGVVVVWMPLAGLSNEMFRLTLRTFHRVFPEMAIFRMHNEWTHFVLLAGWRDRMQVDFRRFVRVLEEPDVRADLAEIGLAEPYKLLASFVTGGRALDRYLAGERVNTQDRPVLEFEAPKDGFAQAASELKTVQTNLMSLMRQRVSARRWIVEGSINDAQLDLFRRYEDAVPYILAGQFHERRAEIEAATRAYLAALELTPEDQTLRKALRFEWLESFARRGNPTSWLFLARSQQLQGNHRRALDLFDRYFRDYEALISPEKEHSSGSLNEAIVQQARAWLQTAHRWRRHCLRELRTREKK